MPSLRVFPRVVLNLTLVVVASTASLQAQVPPSLGVGCHIQVTRVDGTTYTAIVAPKPADPLWQLVTAEGKAVTFRIQELLSVRMLGRAVTLTPGWSSSAQAFAWATVQTTDGQSLELGIYRWPRFTFVRDDTGLTEASDQWGNTLSVVAAVTKPAVLPGLSANAAASILRGSDSYEGTVSLDSGQRDVFEFVRLDTKDRWKVRLQDIHRITKTGRSDGGLDVVEVETLDGQIYTLAMYSGAAFNLVRADTGKREVNVQSYAGFKEVRAGSGRAASVAVAVAPAVPTGEAAASDTLRTVAVGRYEEYLKTGEPGTLGEAAVLAEQLIEAKPNDARAWLLLGQLYRELPPEPVVLALAEDAFTHAVKLEPTLAEARLALGWVLMDLLEYDAALEQFEGVMRSERTRRPPWVIARMNEAYLRDTQFARGVAYWQARLTDQPDADAVRLALAILLNAQGARDAARSELSRVAGREQASPADRKFARALLEAITREGGQR